MPVQQEILDYVQQYILPQYELFDKAHNISHANKVIKNSLSIAADYDIDINKVYVIAAYHDIGLINGRDNHEKHSALCLLADSKLREWFLEDELVLMAEAVEDHRASSKHEPRSIYGKIVSEADRDIEYMTILRRTIQYSLEHFPSYAPEGHYIRVHEHIQNKYGENGYIKLWLDTEVNRNSLSEIRKALESSDKFKMDFYNIFNKIK